MMATEPVGAEPPERRSRPDPDALRAIADGSVRRIGLNLERLRESGAVNEPLVEYLTYIQVQRGENQSLIFVRESDLDELAGLAQTDRSDLEEDLQKLGVMLSMN